MVIPGFLQRPAVLVVCLIAGSASGAAGQANPPNAGAPTNRPYQGLFAGGSANPQPGLILFVTGSGGRDTNVLAGQPGAGTAVLAQRIAADFASGNGALTYLRQHGKTMFMTSLASQGRYYPQLHRPVTYSHAATVLFGFALGDHWNFGVRQNGEYSSFYRMQLMPRNSLPLVAQPPADPASADAGLVNRATIGSDSGIDATHRVTSRTTLRYGYATTHRITTIDGRRMTTQNVSGLYRRQMTRYAGLRLGYGHQTASYRGGLTPSEPLEIHNLDVGLDYSKPLSASRRTTISFTTGSQAFRRTGVMFYRLQGSATLAHQFGRTWEVDAVYDRGVQLSEILQEPMNADTVLLHAEGALVSRRLLLTLDNLFTNGQLSMTRANRGMRTTSGSALLAWSVNERWNLHGSYSRYDYRFDRTVVLPALVPNSSSRQSGAIGITIWMPLLSRGRLGSR